MAARAKVDCGANLIEHSCAPNGARPALVVEEAIGPPRADQPVGGDRPAAAAVGLDQLAAAGDHLKIDMTKDQISALPNFDADEGTSRSQPPQGNRGNSPELSSDRTPGLAHAGAHRRARCP